MFHTLNFRLKVIMCVPPNSTLPLKLTAMIPSISLSNVRAVNACACVFIDIYTQASMLNASKRYPAATCHAVKLVPPCTRNEAIKQTKLRHIYRLHMHACMN